MACNTPTPTLERVLTPVSSVFPWPGATWRAIRYRIKSQRRGMHTILAWVRRCEARFENGRYVRRQLTNAYAVLPDSGWQNYVPPVEAPLPHPSAWGKAEVCPSVLDEAVSEQRASGDRRSVIRTLELAPVGGIQAALARLGRAVLSAGK